MDREYVLVIGSAVLEISGKSEDRIPYRQAPIWQKFTIR